MTSGIRYTRTRGGSLGGEDYFNMAKSLPNIVEEELIDAGRLGADEARQTLDASATGKNWSPGPWGSGGTGDRVETDKMRDSLGYRITHGQSIGLDVGWVDVWEKYFGIQDAGFSSTGFRRPSRTGDVVAGMGIIAHLRTFMHAETDKAVDRIMRRVVDGL